MAGRTRSLYLPFLIKVITMKKRYFVRRNTTVHEELQRRINRRELVDKLWQIVPFLLVVLTVSSLVLLSVEYIDIIFPGN